MMIERLPDQGVDKIGITNEMGVAVAITARCEPQAPSAALCLCRIILLFRLLFRKKSVFQSVVQHGRSQNRALKVNVKRLRYARLKPLNVTFLYSINNVFE